MTTKTSVPLPIIRCLIEAGLFFNQKLVWTPTNKHQVDFLQKVLGDQALDNEARTSPFLEAMADTDVEPINEWFKQRGFSIKLDPIPPGNLALGSILEIYVKWALEGKKMDMNIGGTNYAMAKMGKATAEISETNGTVVATLRTDNPDVRANMAMVPEPKDDDSVHDLAKQLSVPGMHIWNHIFDYEGLVFPMIDLDVQPDISWLQGMATNAGMTGWCISQAKQQTKLRLNHIAARASSAVGMTMRSFSMPKPPLVIDRPFLFFLTHKGVVVFAAWLDKDCWKDPGTV